jgi:hypothetical protein
MLYDQGQWHIFKCRLRKIRSAATILPIGHTPRRSLSALIATVDCGRMTSYAEVIRRRTMDGFGGFRPTRREVVQKSASGKSAPVSRPVVPNDGLTGNNERGEVILTRLT